MSLAAAASPRGHGARRRNGSTGWLVAGLLLFAALPLTFGILRLLQLAGISEIMPPALASPVALVAHIVGALVYGVLGAFQFSPAIRRRWPRWHRMSGRVALVGALAVAASALWLTATYATASLGGVLLAGFRAVVAVGMVLSIAVGVAAALRRDIAHHRAWMIRAYGLGLGSATQMLVLTVAEIITGGDPTELNRALLMGLAWGLNLVVAEWAIHRRRASAVACTNKLRTMRVPPRRAAAYPDPRTHHAVGGLDMTSNETPFSTIPRTMRAAYYGRFGGPEVVHVSEVAVPHPGPDDVLVRVAASTVSAADHRMRARDLPAGIGLLALPVVGLFRPRRSILGMDFAGTVAAVGAAVTRFKPGDPVFGMTGSDFGGHAEFVVRPETSAIAAMPADLGADEAVALLFGGHTISECIRRCAIRPGDDVLVNGASGAVGSAAVQVARHLGARVTAVASAANADLLRGLGADRVIDYRTEDFAAGPEQYDVIFECVGNAPFARVDRILKPGGALLEVAADLRSIVEAKSNSRRSGKRVIPINFTPTAADVAFAARLYREGGLKPVVDLTYRLGEIVEAHRYVDTGRKRGSVVVQVTRSLAPPSLASGQQMAHQP